MQMLFVVVPQKTEFIDLVTYFVLPNGSNDCRVHFLHFIIFNSNQHFSVTIEFKILNSIVVVHYHICMIFSD